MINCVIVDDQQFSVDVIVKYAKLMDHLNIIGIYLNPKDALRNITGQPGIDILFLDIDMPEITGIELARLLKSHCKKLVFTTSHSIYAFDAYEVNGDAFLLKPFTFVKFADCINRLFPNNHPINSITEKVSTGHFLVKNKDENLRIIRISYDDVLAFESVNNYVKIHIVNNKKVMAYLTLKDVLEITSERPEFKQFHRAFVISANHISYIEGNTIYLNEHLSFNIGERFKDNFSNYLAVQLLKTNRGNKSKQNQDL
jgi:DNA-binding LytR/AlgR family response regulator